MATFGDVVEAINRWKPSRCVKENDYRDSLEKYLRQELNRSDSYSFFPEPKITIRKEAGRGLCDLEINRKLGIEIKKDLNTKSKVDRLCGQMNNYEREYKYIIVVLVGKTSENHLEHLRMDLDYRRKRLGWGDDKEFKVVVK